MTAIGQGAVPTDLERRLAALEAAVGARRHLVLEAGRERAFLGAAVELTARVGGTAEGTAGGAPAAGAAVTFAATWGRLAAAEGYQRLAGGAVTLRAWPDGTARAVLEPPLPRPPSGAEREALDTHLGALDPDAATPEEAAAGLESLVRAYRWEPGGDLRRAVDGVFGQLADDPAAAAGGDPASAWPFVEATVFAHLHAADGGVERVAVAGVRILDWRPAWLAVFRRVAAEDDRLEEELRRELERRRARGGDAAGTLLDGLYATVGRYVDERRGAVGATVGRHVAGRALATFTDRGLADLPVEVRLPVGEGLSGAVRVVEAAGGGDLLAGIGRARGEARREVVAVAEETRGALAGKADAAAVDRSLTDLRGDLGHDLAAKADAILVDSLRGDLDRGLAAKADRGALDLLGGELRGELAQGLTGKADRSALDGLRADLRGDLDRGLAGKLDRSALDTLGAELRRDLDRGLAGKADRGALDVLGDDLRGRLDAKADVAALDATRRALEAAVATRAERGEVDRLRTALDGNLRILQREVPRFTVQNPEVFRPVVIGPILPPGGGPGGPR